MDNESIRRVEPAEQNRPRRTIYLSFDDSPHPSITYRILGQLRRRNVTATFFVVGSRLRRPGALDIVATAIADGHAIGNHTMNHRDLTICSVRELQNEIVGVHAILKTLAITPTLVRPPYGRTNSIVAAAIHQLGCRIALWDNDPRDWSKSSQPDRWVNAAVNGVLDDNHHVIICHDTHATTAAHLPKLLERLQGERCRFSTLPERRELRATGD